MDRSFFRFVTMHAFDKETDRQTDQQTDRILIAIDRVCITCKMYRRSSLYTVH